MTPDAINQSVLLGRLSMDNSPLGSRFEYSLAVEQKGNSEQSKLVLFQYALRDLSDSVCRGRTSIRSFLTGIIPFPLDHTQRLVEPILKFQDDVLTMRALCRETTTHRSEL